MVIVLAVAWGALAAVPVLWIDGRARAATRARSLRVTPAANRACLWSRPMRAIGSVGGRAGRNVVGRVVTGALRSRRTARAQRALTRDLPITIDLVRVAVTAGCTPSAAVDLAARWGPAGPGSVLDGVRRRWTLGEAFGDALASAARSTPPMQALFEVLATTARTGAPVAPALDRLASEARAALRRRAEARARTQPVRLLFPLVFLVLPAFALLTVVPVVLTGVDGA